jgi:uracil-DNA glycosylase family 4
MDADQADLANPFGMDEACTNCPALCETRETIVHGYGDVGAEFLILFEQPSEGADAAGYPFEGAREAALLSLLADVGLTEDENAADRPELGNVFVTYVTRCRHPDREATEAEEQNCEPFLNGEIRMINPELLVPVGQRALEALTFEYTTLSPETVDVRDRHASTLRGRGFELLPMIDPLEQSSAERRAVIEHLEETLDRDYRQTKGRRSR